MQLKQRTMLYEEQQPQRRPADPVPLPLGGGGGEAEAVPPMFLCPITQVRLRVAYVPGIQVQGSGRLRVCPCATHAGPSRLLGCTEIVLGKRCGCV